MELFNPYQFRCPVTNQSKMYACYACAHGSPGKLIQVWGAAAWWVRREVRAAPFLAFPISSDR
jgi:hypothetical protein